MKKKIKNLLSSVLVMSIFSTAITGCDLIVGDGTSEEDKTFISLTKEIYNQVDSVTSITDKVDSSLLTKNKVSEVREIYNSKNELIAYGYNVAGTGRNGDINMIVVISSSEDKVIGIKVLSHSETPSYGGEMLENEEFINIFDNISINSLPNKADFNYGASLTFNGVVDGVKKSINVHNNYLGKVSALCEVTDVECKKVDINSSYKAVDKTEEVFNSLRNKIKESRYNNLVNKLNLLYYVELQDSSNNVKNYIYIVKGSYNCEAEAGVRKTQTYRIALKFDNNWANSKLIVLSSNDTLSSKGMAGLETTDWVNSFNGMSIDELTGKLNNFEIDSIAGATFSSSSLKDKVSVILEAHQYNNI